MSSVYDNLTIHSSSVVYIFHKGIFFFKGLGGYAVQMIVFLAKDNV